MRILHCIHSCNPRGGGAWEAVAQYSRELLNRNYENFVVTVDDPKQRYCQDTDIEIIALGPSNNYGFTSSLLPWLKNHAEEFEVVFVHGLWQYHGYAVRKALFCSATPYFIFPHGMMDPWFKSAHPFKHFKKTIYWKSIERFNFLYARAVLYTCLEEQILAKHTFSPYRCSEKVVPLGISLPNIKKRNLVKIISQQYPDILNKEYILYLGRLHPKKGLDLLLKGFLKNKSKPPDLVISGPIDETDYIKNIKNLEQQVRSKFPSWYCFWTGMIVGELKWALLCNASAFILPSHQENFGIAVVESLAVGTPVIVTNKINIYREILSGEAGIVSDDSISGINNAVTSWQLLSEKRKAEMSNNAKTCFRKNFEITKATDLLLGVISTSV